MPRIEPIWRKYRESGLAVVAIDTVQQGKAALKFIAEKDLTFTFLETHLGPDDPVRTQFAIIALPVNLLVDAEGRILYYHAGYVDGDEARIEAEIRALLGLEE